MYDIISTHNKSRQLLMLQNSICIYLANSFSSLLMMNESEEHEDGDDDDYINLVVVVEEGAVEIVVVLLVITSDKLTHNARKNISLIYVHVQK